jgi:hypothetical protein
MAIIECALLITFISPFIFSLLSYTNGIELSGQINAEWYHALGFYQRVGLKMPCTRGSQHGEQGLMSRIFNNWLKVRVLPGS